MKLWQSCRICYVPASEHSIRDKPLIIVLEECLILSRCKCCSAFLIEKVVQISAFGVVHCLIVDLCEGIQLLTLCLIICGFLGILKRRKLAAVNILRMERID